MRVRRAPSSRWPPCPRPATPSHRCRCAPTTRSCARPERPASGTSPPGSRAAPGPAAPRPPRSPPTSTPRPHRPGPPGTAGRRRRRRHGCRPRQRRSRGAAHRRAAPSRRTPTTGRRSCPMARWRPSGSTAVRAGRGPHAAAPRARRANRQGQPTRPTDKANRQGRPKRPTGRRERHGPVVVRPRAGPRRDRPGLSVRGTGGAAAGVPVAHDDVRRDSGVQEFCGPLRGTPGRRARVPAVRLPELHAAVVAHGGGHVALHVVVPAVERDHHAPGTAGNVGRVGGAGRRHPDAEAQTGGGGGDESAEADGGALPDPGPWGSVAAGWVLRRQRRRGAHRPPGPHPPGPNARAPGSTRRRRPGVTAVRTTAFALVPAVVRSRAKAGRPAAAGGHPGDCRRRNGRRGRAFPRRSGFLPRSSGAGIRSGSVRRFRCAGLARFRRRRLGTGQGGSGVLRFRRRHGHAWRSRGIRHQRGAGRAGWGRRTGCGPEGRGRVSHRVLRIVVGPGSRTGRPLCASGCPRSADSCLPPGPAAAAAAAGTTDTPEALAAHVVETPLDDPGPTETPAGPKHRGPPGMPRLPRLSPVADLLVFLSSRERVISRQASAVLPEHALLSVGRVRATRAWRSTIG
ncbi:hypothetical protein SAMN06272789_7067 [Streptomyces sp. 1331.2]|nr:hypothetical protein SAMN06272789_7067 [Streptomyces sp. 1331.2]